MRTTLNFAKRHTKGLALLFSLIGLTGLLLAAVAIDRQVAFSDANLEAAIREELDKPLKPLYTSELNKVVQLDASGRGITSLDGIQYLHNLAILNLESNEIQDVSSLSSLKKLHTLNLGNNGITDLQSAHLDALSGLPLRHLNLNYNVVIFRSGQRTWLTDISIIGTFTSLEELTLIENQITDISPLSALTNLRLLDLSTNAITGIEPLAHTAALQSLSLANNDIRDITPLADLHQLTFLNLLSNENIASVRPLTGLTNLETLILDNVPVGDEISALANKHELRELSMANTRLTAIPPLGELTLLSSLNLRDNDIVDLTPLSSLARLKTLNLQSNPHIASIQPLAGLIQLKELDIQDVPIGAEISALSNLQKLQTLDARNCAISDTSVLGELMQHGALQDGKNNRKAFIDLRDNPLQVNQSDAYLPIRPYWQNIDRRLPFVLPEHNTLAAPVFSASGGYYQQSFELTLTAEAANASIYYTLDGSEPTPDSPQYTTPLLIQSRVGEPNKFSAIPDVSPRWIPPAGEVFKATVVRARVISNDGQASSPTATNTFIVDKEKRYTLPVVSVVTDAANFFDDRYGIYVMGDIYNQLYDPASSLNPWERPANYIESGQEWERLVHLEYFDVNGDSGFSVDANARIHGAATRERAQKSLRLYTVCESTCNESIAYNIFPGLTSEVTGEPIQAFKTILLRNSGNDWERTLFRDALLQRLVDHTSLDTQAYQPTVVFLNGEYWGIHNLRERLDEYYLESHYGIALDEVTILAEDELIITGELGDEQDYLDMLAFAASHDMAAPANYAYIKTQMDVENYIDYQLSEIYFDNANWPHVNIKFWQKKTGQPDDSAVPYGHDGKWRWMLYDTDFGFGFDGGPKNAENNSLLIAIHPDWHDWAGLLFRSLLENPEFRAAFVTRFADQINTSFEPQRVSNEIDQMQAVIAPEIEEHIRRWRGTEGTLAEWQDSVEVLHGFAALRPENVQQHLSDYFELGTTVKVHLQTDSQMGYIRINTIDLVESTPGVFDPASWTGTYFTGLPVEITAIPYPGYQFSAWETPDGTIQTEHLSLYLDTDTTLTAIFTAE
jgi:Leucine-rich repeat (LRR) protein